MFRDGNMMGILCLLKGDQSNELDSYTFLCLHLVKKIMYTSGVFFLFLRSSIGGVAYVTVFNSSDT